jgi:hypothetical protein
MANITDVESTRKCAYEQCQCQVPSTEEYCSGCCSDADDVAEVEFQCNCEHPSCLHAACNECVFDRQSQRKPMLPGR